MARSKAAKTRNPRTDRAEAIQSALKHFHAGIDALAAVLAAPEQPVCEPVRREVMKPSDYADYMRVSVRKVHSWVKKGMPHFLLEGRVRIRATEADAWQARRARSKAREKKSQ